MKGKEIEWTRINIFILLSTAKLETYGEKQIWERDDEFCFRHAPCTISVGFKTEQNTTDSWRCRFQARFWRHILESYQRAGERGHFRLGTSSLWGVVLCIIASYV